MYITHTDAELTDELKRLKTELQSLVTKWTAGDTSVERAESQTRVESQLRQVVAEIEQRPALSKLVQRPRERTAVASFS